VIPSWRDWGSRRWGGGKATGITTVLALTRLQERVFFLREVSRFFGREDARGRGFEREPYLAEKATKVYGRKQRPRFRGVSAKCPRGDEICLASGGPEFTRLVVEKGLLVGWPDR